MSAYKSGLSYEKLSQAAAANALDTLSAGGYRKNGKKYQGTVSYIDSTGDKPKRVNLTKQFSDTSSAPTNRGGTGKREMEARVVEWVAQVREDIESVAGLTKDPTQPLITCVMKFIDAKVTTSEDGDDVGVRKSTVGFYHSAANRLNMSPSLANKPLNEVRDTDISAWVKTMAKTLARKTIADSLGIVSQTFNSYVGRDNNPCLSSEVEVPRNTRKTFKNRNSTRPNTLNAGGIMRLNDELDKREKAIDGLDFLVIAARLALNTGMRCGEVCALRWQDVDFINGWIYVTHSIEKSTIDGVYSTSVAQPKTESSIRDIAITPELEEILTERMVAVSEKLEEMPEDERPDLDSLYVINGTERSYYDPHKLTCSFSNFCSAKRRRILGTEGTPITFHNLRDTFATISLKEHPEMLAEISRALGHSKIQMTLDKYVGYNPEDQKKFMKTVSKTFALRTPEDVAQLHAGTIG